MYQHSFDISIKNIGENYYLLDDIYMKLLCLPPVNLIFDVFERKGYEIRVVGGAVRDVLLKKYPKDVDFATNAKPDEIQSICVENKIHCIPTGLKHGTLTLVINKSNFEVTTLRVDKLHDGRHAVVEYIHDWKLDAERRDLTVNAMSISSDGRLYDYFSGLDHLKARKIVFVNDPCQRITEDYLRILRYFRFYSKIGNCNVTNTTFDADVLAVIKNSAPNLSKIARERVWMELSQILVGKFAPGIVKIIYESGVFKYCGVNLDKQLSIDTFTRVYDAAVYRLHRHDIPKVKGATMLAAFFDDVDFAEEVCKDMKLSNEDTAICLFVIKNRSKSKDGKAVCYSIKHYKKILMANIQSPRYEYFLKLVTQLMLYDGVNNSQILDLISWELPEFPLKGTDLLDKCKRKEIGFHLSVCREKWIDSEFKLDKEALLELVQD